MNVKVIKLLRPSSINQIVLNESNACNSSNCHFVFIPVSETVKQNDLVSKLHLHVQQIYFIRFAIWLWYCNLKHIPLYFLIPQLKLLLQPFL